MIPKTIIIIVILLSLTSVAINAGIEDERINACPAEARVIEIGEFHGNEVDAKTGEKWLGLHISDKASMLLNYEVTVEPVHDPIMDEEDQKTGKEVKVDLPVEPLFLVDAEWIEAGTVQTIFKGDYESLARTAPVTLKLGDTSYELKVIGSDEGEKCGTDGLPKNAKLVLTSGEFSQVLYALKEECGSDPYWHLVWAGDLDGDGKLDLYLNVNQHYNTSQKKLFLSSPAGEGQLVEEIAEFVTSGC
jgi:hypothetical protein